MTDTMKRLSGATPIAPAHSLAGTGLYTPGAGVLSAHCKSLTVTNHDLTSGAYFYMSLGAMATQTNRIVDHLWVPPAETLIVPIDVVVSNAASDVLNCRQSPLYATTRVVAPSQVALGGGANSTTDATTYTTGSWTEKNGAVYIMTVYNSKAAAAEQPVSFTDTHTGITWTLLQTQLQADGLSRMSQYVAKSTGTSATTTAVNFTGTQTGCTITITELGPNTTTDTRTGWDNSDSNGATGVLALGFTETTTAGTTPRHVNPSLNVEPAQYAAIGLSAVGAAVGVDAGWTELDDVNRATPSNSLETAYILQPTTTNQPTITSGVSLMGWLGLYSAAAPLTVILNGVENTA